MAGNTENSFHYTSTSGGGGGYKGRKMTVCFYVFRGFLDVIYSTTERHATVH